MAQRNLYQTLDSIYFLFFHGDEENSKYPHPYLSMSYIMSTDRGIDSMQNMTLLCAKSCNIKKEMCFNQENETSNNKTVKDISRLKFKLFEGLVNIMWEREGLL